MDLFSYRASIPLLVSALLGGGVFSVRTATALDGGSCVQKDAVRQTIASQQQAKTSENRVTNKDLEATVLRLVAEEAAITSDDHSSGSQRNIRRDPGGVSP